MLAPSFGVNTLDRGGGKIAIHIVNRDEKVADVIVKEYIRNNRCHLYFMGSQDPSGEHYGDTNIDIQEAL